MKVENVPRQIERVEHAIIRDPNSAFAPPLEPVMRINFEHLLLWESPDCLFNRFDVAHGPNVVIWSSASRWKVAGGKPGPFIPLSPFLCHLLLGAEKGARRWDKGMGTEE